MSGNQQPAVRSPRLMALGRAQRHRSSAAPEGSPQKVFDRPYGGYLIFLATEFDRGRRLAADNVVAFAVFARGSEVSAASSPPRRRATTPATTW